MNEQLIKYLPLNADQNEGRLVLPNCQLLIKYASPEQLEVTIDENSVAHEPTNNRVEKLHRDEEKTSLQDAQIGRFQRELVNLLKQMPEMQSSFNRNKLIPLEFRKNRSGIMDLSGELEADLKIIIGKSDSMESLNSTIVQAMNISQCEDMQEKLKKLHIGLKAFKPGQKIKSNEKSKNLGSPDKRLFELLRKTFNNQELIELCFYLKIDYEELKGLSKREKMLDLIGYLDRRKRISELLGYCNHYRPKEDWPSAHYWEF